MTDVHPQSDLGPRGEPGPRRGAGREPGVSACLIVRDEEEWLGRCLESLRPWVDELCVLDTGSSDRTVEIARAHGARVRHSPWEDDFAAARNGSLEMASRRWILIVDADEELTEEGGRALRRAIEHPSRQSWLVRVDSPVGEAEVRSIAVPRLFRNRPEIRFRRRVHESVMESLLALGEAELPASGVSLLHHGYRPEVLRERDKRARNQALLRRCLAEDEDDLFALHKLSSSVVGAERRRLLEHAVAVASRMTPEERRTYPFLPRVYERLARESIHAGELGRALETVEQGLATFGDVPELRFRRGDLARRIGDDKSARRWLASCVGEREGTALYVSDPSARGVRPLLGLVRSAVDAGRRDEAWTLVEHALALAPEDGAARRFEVELKLLDPETQAEGLAALSWLVAEEPTSPEVLVIAGRFAWTSGDPETAMGLWRSVATHRADAGLEARGLLVVGHLARGELDAAAEQIGGSFVARDVPSAATLLLASVVLARPVELDPALRGDAVLRHLVTLLGDLLGAGQGDAISCFAANAPGYETVLPGIGNLLVDDGTP